MKPNSLPQNKAKVIKICRKVGVVKQLLNDGDAMSFEFPQVAA